MNNTQHLYIKTKRLECRPLTLQDYSRWKTAHSQTLPQQNLFDRAPKTPDQLTLTAYKKILKPKNWKKNVRDMIEIHNWITPPSTINLRSSIILL
jgi:hypothetical protein